MNARHELFKANYLKTKNATTAARAAGYSEKSAATQGSRLLKRLDIQGALAQSAAKSEKKAAEKAASLADQVLSELSALAFGNLQDLFDPETGQLLPINKLPREVAAMLTTFENDKGSQKVKTASKISALELLAKITQLVRQEPPQTAVQIIVAPHPELPPADAERPQLKPVWE
jgi:phage terminase small subunit